MMKRLLILFLFALGIIYVILSLSSNSIRNFVDTAFQETPKVTLTPQQNTASPEKPPQISVNGRNYAYHLFFADPKRITLIENVQQDESEALAKANQCISFANGGYYTSNFKPLGLFISEGNKKYPVHESKTLDGFFWISSKGSLGISATMPTQPNRITLQAGPLLIDKSGIRSLNIVNDTTERRTVIGLTTTNQLFFLIVYDGQSVYLGPYLASLPTVVSKVVAQENMEILDALNLDGGTASAFKSGEVFLNEFKTVGSIFCVK